MTKIVKKKLKKIEKRKEADNVGLAEITADTMLSKIIEFPLAQEILLKYNLPCLTCPMAKFEMEALSLGQVSGAYGLDLENMIKELNEAIKPYSPDKK
jgi:hypothetical protein